MSKTVLQVANEIGISKQRLYRYIKNHITDVHQIDGVIYIDEVAETLIKSQFLKDNTSSDVHHDSHHDAAFDVVIETLKKQLEQKDRQIENLQTALLQEQENVKMAQQLHGAEKVHQLTDGQKKHWWSFK